MKTAHYLTISSVAFLLGLGVAPAMAQTSANDDTLQSAAIDRMVDRDLNQENRIDQGLNNGSLTADEAARLQRGEAHIDNMESHALSDGQLSAQEAARIRLAEREESLRITAAANNNVSGTPTASSTVLANDVQRNANQQARILQGVDNGNLTVTEVSNLENGQAGVNASESAAARDGSISADEQANIRASEQTQSNNIRDDRHNDAVGTGLAVTTSANNAAQREKNHLRQLNGNNGMAVVPPETTVNTGVTASEAASTSTSGTSGTGTNAWSGQTINSSPAATSGTTGNVTTSGTSVNTQDNANATATTPTLNGSVQTGGNSSTNVQPPAIAAQPAPMPRPGAVPHIGRH